ncbi:tRNA sulfurtransferase [Halorientalis salina]|uniref:tRNA sulfurtransferase n=1 Tax=Halorientalis salina TaxID=2932266 RepID=UPI0010ABA92D|nr:tRNA sulfurtransferase [Halorientalis salina]
MKPPGAETVVVRYGDMSTKSSRVRRDMERQLVENIDALLIDRGIPGDVERHSTRPLVRTTTDAVEDAAATAADAFGVVSTSPARSLPSEKGPILDALAETARACYDGGSFAVDARRSGTDYPFTSVDIEEAGGQAVWEAVEDDFEPEVDLEDPDITFSVEIREDEAFLFFEAVDGPGGMPLGSQRAVVALVSGGIDSPVAAYEIMRTGCPILPVYVDLGEYGGPDHRARAAETVRTLQQYAPNFEMPLRVVPGGDTVSRLAADLGTGRMLVFRRFCLLVAEEIALDADARGIVTGESIGQKSSQTAQNISVTSPVTDLPVYRPLLTTDKNVITERAKEIGTFHDSTIPAGCNRFAPAQAETNAHLDRLRRIEPDDLRERARDAVADAELVDVA